MAKNIFTPKDINSITIMITSEGIEDSKRHLKHSLLRFGVYLSLKIRLECLQDFTENDCKITQNNYCPKVIFKMKLQNL